MARDPYKYFRIEARELLEQIGKDLLDLEKGPPAPELMSRLLRLTHTLKGAARVVKQVGISESAHAIEELLMPLRESGAAVPREGMDRLLQLHDAIGAGVAELDAPQSSEPAAAGKPLPEETFRTVRADVGEMDALLDGVTETHVQVKALRRNFTAVERARALAGLLPQTVARQHESGSAAAAQGAALAQELAVVLEGLEEDLTVAADRIERELHQLRDAAEQLRLLPVRTLFTPLERAVRDAARELGKEAVFETSGAEVRLDAHALGALQGALLQMVRNAVAHGIETAAQRRAAGKPAIGRVALEVTRRGQQIAFTCTDDGRGIDLEAVRRAAQRKGLPAAEIRELDAAGLLRLLLRGGISTSATVTEVAGRGIGLDLARETAERLGGEINVRAEAGKGTVIELVVPLSLAAVDAVIVEAAGTIAAIPLDMVRRTLRVAPADFSAGARGQSIADGDSMIPFAPLARVLRHAKAGGRSAQSWSAVVIRGKAGSAALGVDRLLGTANIVFRPLPELAPRSALVSGASLDAEGNPQLVLDVDGIIEEMSRADTAAVAPAPARVSVLVVDDSLTTRMLEKSILESAGFDVGLASCAEDGLEAARAGNYALFLVDVEMPGMDGFGFVEQVRADPKLRDTPAILITSRNSAADLQRGKDVGAQRYIVKSAFDQREFLEHIRQLLA